MCPFFPNTSPYRELTWLNPYKELGKRFREFSILSLIYAFFAVVDILRNTNIMGIIGISIFIYQVLFGSNAKKAAREFNHPVLSQFGTFIILSFVLYLVSICINIIPTVYVLMSNATTGSLYITPYSLASAIVEICSIALQLKAWYSMATFYQATEVPDIQARGMKWTRLVINTIFIELGEVVLLGIPLAIMKSVIDLSTGSMIVPNSAMLFQEIEAASMIVWGILTLIGYFKVGDAFLSLETSKMPE